VQSHVALGRERLILSSGDLVLREVSLDKSLMTIGRRPYCDVVLDDLTVSAEHASISLEGDRRVVRDLRSRNGVLINGKAIQLASLVHGDDIQIGVYHLRFELKLAANMPEKKPFKPDEATYTGVAVVQVLKSETDKGNEQPLIALDKPIVSLGAKGSFVAVIRRRASGYYLTHLEGPSPPIVNGEVIGLMAYPLAHDDLIELGPNTYRFRQSG
jgi:Inner membrane component of T3SS, cytoplasmic domain